MAPPPPPNLAVNVVRSPFTLPLLAITSLLALILLLTRDKRSKAFFESLTASLAGGLGLWSQLSPRLALPLDSWREGSAACRSAMVGCFSSVGDAVRSFEWPSSAEGLQERLRALWVGVASGFDPSRLAAWPNEVYGRAVDGVSAAWSGLMSSLGSRGGGDANGGGGGGHDRNANPHPHQKLQEESESEYEEETETEQESTPPKQPPRGGFGTPQSADNKAAAQAAAAKAIAAKMPAQPLGSPPQKMGQQGGTSARRQSIAALSKRADDDEDSDGLPDESEEEEESSTAVSSSTASPPRRKR